MVKVYCTNCGKEQTADVKKCVMSGWPLCCGKSKNCRRVKHIFKEGSRQHIISWDSKGRHCSVSQCEINCKEGE